MVKLCTGGHGAVKIGLKRQNCVLDNETVKIYENGNPTNSYYLTLLQT